MKPIWPAEVENQSGPSPYAEPIEQVNAAGAVIPQIFHLFRYEPNVYKPNVGQRLAQLTARVCEMPEEEPWLSRKRLTGRGYIF